MSKIDELIQQYCPNGVEFYELRKVAKISNGKDHKSLDDGSFPVYGSGGIMRYANNCGCALRIAGICAIEMAGN